MDGILIAIFVAIGLLSLCTSAYFAYRSYSFARENLRKNIEQAEEDFRDDLHRISLEELMQTKSGRELLTLLTNADKSEWNDLDYRTAAKDMAKQREMQERQKSKKQSWVNHNAT